MRTAPPVLALLRHFNIDVQLERGEANAKCPFHDEQTASFGVRLKDGLWNCFGCRKSGGFLSLVQALQGKGLLQAMLLARRLEKEPMPPSSEEEEPDVNWRGPLDILQAWRSYHPVNWATVSANQPVAAYLIRRGFKRETLSAFDVRLTESLSYPVVFPIVRDGELLGIVRRRIDSVPQKKYLYNVGFRATESMAYHKVGEVPVLIVEGIMDYMKAVQFGYAHVAAILSWRITRHQVAWLRLHGVREVICALDNTPSGHEGCDLLKSRFEVMEFAYPGKHKKDVGDLDVAQFWIGIEKSVYGGE